MKTISAVEFLSNAKIYLGPGAAGPGQVSSGRASSDQASSGQAGQDPALANDNVNDTVNEIIAAVRAEGDEALWRYSRLFEKALPKEFEVPPEAAKEAWENLKSSEPSLAASLSFAAGQLRRFGELQKEGFKNFEAEISPGLFAGQRVIPIERAAVYVPGGRYPLISSALMGLIPAAVAGVNEKILVSPPGPEGVPDRRILAAAYLAGADRFFCLGGAQAIAALALGTETVPKADLIVGAGNKYVAAAKAILYGEVGIDFIAGPTDLLVITDTAVLGASNTSMIPEVADVMADDVNMIAADMLAQAEHDPDARVRVLVPDMTIAALIEKALEFRLTNLSTAETARASLEAGLIIVYDTKEEALSIANRIAPEHIELYVSAPGDWIEDLKNYGSLFIGSASAEVLGDYSAGINHTLPTSGSARFTGGLSVGNFLKTVTTLRCFPDSGYAEALEAAGAIALAEGLSGHAESAALRLSLYRKGGAK